MPKYHEVHEAFAPYAWIKPLLEKEFQQVRRMYNLDGEQLEFWVRNSASGPGKILAVQTAQSRIDEDDDGRSKIEQWISRANKEPG